jgi:predicted secreted protein
VWRLFWTSFLTLAMLIGLYCMFFFTVLLAVLPLSMVTHMTGTPTMEPMTQGPPTVPTEFLTLAAVGLGVWLIVASLISAVVHALALAPWAAAYKGLTSEGAEHG